MTDEQTAQKLLERCFYKEELIYLQTCPEFAQAARHMLNIEGALKAIEIGERLVRQRWKKLGYRNSAFTPKDIERP